MANALIEKQYVQDIADAIRSKNGLTTKYKPGQMDDAISAIDTDPSGDATATASLIVGNTTKSKNWDTHPTVDEAKNADSQYSQQLSNAKTLLSKIQLKTEAV